MNLTNASKHALNNHSMVIVSGLIGCLLAIRKSLHPSFPLPTMGQIAKRVAASRVGLPFKPREDERKLSTVFPANSWLFAQIKEKEIVKSHWLWPERKPHFIEKKWNWINKHCCILISATVARLGCIWMLDLLKFDFSFLCVCVFFNKLTPLTWTPNYETVN